MPRPIRVIHVINWLNRGGLESWLMGILRASDKSRFRMDFLCKGAHPGILADEARTLGASVLHVPLGRLEQAAGSPARLADALKGREYDVLHSHLGYLSAGAARASRLAGIPRTVVTFHSPVHRLGLYYLPALGRIPGFRAVMDAWQQRQIAAISENCDAITACSNSAARAIFGSNDAERASVLPPAIDHERFLKAAGRRSESRALLKLKESDFVIVNVGRLDFPKNQGVIPLLAAADWGARGRPVFLIAGAGPLEREIRATAKALGVEESVRLLGEQADMPGLLAAADAAFHPSVVEGLPVAVLEYQAAGLRVVASDIEALQEALCPNGGHFNLRHDDVAGYREAFLRIRSEGSAHFRTANLDWIAGSFSAEASLKNLEALYMQRRT